MKIQKITYPSSMSLSFPLGDKHLGIDLPVDAGFYRVQDKYPNGEPLVWFFVVSKTGRRRIAEPLSREQFLDYAQGFFEHPEIRKSYNDFLREVVETIEEYFNDLYTNDDYPIPYGIMSSQSVKASICGIADRIIEDNGGEPAYYRQWGFSSNEEAKDYLKDESGKIPDLRPFRKMLKEIL